MMCTPAMMSIVLLSSIVQGAPTPCALCTRGMITEPEGPIAIPGYEFVDSCASLQYLLLEFLTTDDPQCHQMQSLSTLCGCPPPENACSFCPDGSNIAYPEKEVPWLTVAFGGSMPTCELVEAFSASLLSDDEACTLLQAISSHCGCAPLSNPCSYCDGESLREEFKDKEVPFLSNEDLGIVGTCELFWTTQYHLPRDDYSTCGKSHFVTSFCGCNNGIVPYYGTSSASEQIMMTWLSRSIGILSLVASCLVLRHILVSPKKRAGVYQQLILLITVFDMVTSLVWIVGPAAVNKIDEISGIPWGIYGAYGTSATCTASGFFFQLGGATSVLFTLSLTIYYYLVIVRGVKEPKLRQLRPWLFVPPLLIGFALSFGAIPFIEEAWSTCQPRVTPVEQYPLRIVILFVLPVTLSTVSILVLLLVIYLKVRFQMRRNTERVSFPSILQTCASGLFCKHSSARGRRSAQERLECAVTYQCISYAAAYGLTWPVLLLAGFQGENFDFPLWFWIIALTVAPIQGLSNSICYFRPYMSKSLTTWSGDRRLINVENHRVQTSTRQRPRPAPEHVVRRCAQKVSGLLRSSFFQSDEESEADHPADPTVELANLSPYEQYCQEDEKDRCEEAGVPNFSFSGRAADAARTYNTDTSKAEPSGL